MSSITDFDGLDDISLANKAIDSANDGITIADMRLPDQPLIFINKAFEAMTGYTKAEAVGRNCRFLQNNQKDQPELAIIHRAFENRSNCRVVLRNFKKDGSQFFNELSLAPIIDSNGSLCYYVGIQKDVTTEVMQKEKISYLFEHDDLTGIYNYRGFFARISHLLTRAKNENLMMAMGIADIDFFKKINDQYGHLNGNQILKIMGSELIREFSGDDIVARFGGDEFCFAMLTKENSSDFFYEKIAKVISATNSAFDNQFHISMSSGVVMEKVNNETRVDRLIRLADNIMYENKQAVHLEMLNNKDPAV